MTRARLLGLSALLGWTLVGCGGAGRTYEWVASWEGHGLEGPIGVAVGLDGSVPVSDSGNHRIVQFDPAGRLLRTFGDEGSAPGQLNRPMHIATDSRGHLYVAEYLNDRIQVFDADGSPARLLGSGIFDAPGGVAVGRHGFVYVADFYHHRVVKLRSDGEAAMSWGRQGRYWGGRFQYPTDVAIQENGNVIVADAYNHRIQVFSKEGTFIRTWGGPLGLGFKGNRRGQFHVATGVGVDTQGRVYVADFYNHRVQVFSATGRWLGGFGRHGAGSGEFDRPTDVVVAADGTIYVVDFGNDRIQLFRALGVADER